MVGADADIGAWMPGRAALAHNDVAGDDSFAAEFLDAKTPSLGVAAVAG